MNKVKIQTANTGHAVAVFVMQVLYVALFFWAATATSGLLSILLYVAGVWSTFSTISSLYLTLEGLSGNKV